MYHKSYYDYPIIYKSWHLTFIRECGWVIKYGMYIKSHVKKHEVGCHLFATALFYIFQWVSREFPPVFFPGIIQGYSYTWISHMRSSVNVFHCWSNWSSSFRFLICTNLLLCLILWFPQKYKKYYRVGVPYSRISPQYIL